ncbi:MAG: hypothetical protein ACREVL_12515 [Solimonas sp.]
MVMKPYAGDAQRRQERQQSYEAAPTVGGKWPGVQSIAVDFRFVSDESRSLPMPYRQLFLPEMRAFFEFLCPDPECRSGGFDLSGEVARSRTRAGHQSSGTLECRGRQPVRGSSGTGCPIRLQFAITFESDAPVTG